MSEEKILISAKIAILCHSFINVYENIMVCELYYESFNMNFRLQGF